MMRSRAGAMRCMQLTRDALELHLEPATLEQGYAQGVQTSKDAQWSALGLKRAPSVLPERAASEHLP